jgi:hypothetical protein
MKRDDILKLAASCAQQGESVIALAYEMIEFLEGEEKEKAPSKEKVEQRVAEILSVLKPPKDEFYIAPEKIPPHPFLPFAAPRIKQEGTTTGPEGDTHTDRPKRKSPTEPENRPGNHRRKWSEPDKRYAAALLEKAKTEQDILDAAASLGRTRDGIMEQAYKGYLPIDHTRLEKKLFPLWKKVPFKKAEI